MKATGVPPGIGPVLSIDPATSPAYKVERVEAPGAQPGAQKVEEKASEGARARAAVSTGDSVAPVSFVGPAAGKTG